MDARPESLRGYPWRRRPRPTLEELLIEFQAAGVGRFVFSHVASDGVEPLRNLAANLDAEVLVAGGVTNLDGLRTLRDAGIAGVILGEALFTGSIDLAEASRAVA